MLAAYRAGLRQLIMPKANEKDLRDVPDEVKKQVAFSFVATMDEVLRLALMEPSADDAPPEERPSAAPTPDTYASVPVMNERDGQAVAALSAG